MTLKSGGEQYHTRPESIVFFDFNLNPYYFIISRYANSPLPTDLNGMASVPYGNTFLLVGGECMDQCDPAVIKDEILHFDPDTETWLIREEKMTLEKKRFGVLMVEDRIIF